MADAPEVVSSPLSPESPYSPGQHSPYSPGQSQTFQTPTTSPQNEKKNPHDPGARALQLAYGEEKQALSNDEIAPKTALSSQPETEETNPKIGYAHDDRAGSGMEPAAAARSHARQDAKVVDSGHERAVANSNAENEWHFGFWSSCVPSSLCFESIFCPCVLTGRTHLRLHEPDNVHFPSTNGYCAGCFGLCMLGIGALPLFCFMTTAQRREVRHRYNIKGNNGDDCWKATFCAWCSLVQEEREVVWREEQKKLVASQQPGKREDTMVYSTTRS